MVLTSLDNLGNEFLRDGTRIPGGWICLLVRGRGFLVQLQCAEVNDQAAAIGLESLKYVSKCSVAQ